MRMYENLQKMSMKEKDMVERNASKDNCFESAEDIDSCPICMCRVSKQKIASVDKCKHAFCIECIENWTKKQNTCTICRVHFNNIFVDNSWKEVRVRNQYYETMSDAAREELGEIFNEVSPNNNMRMVDRVRLFIRNVQETGRFNNDILEVFVGHLFVVGDTAVNPIVIDDDITE